MSHTLFLLALVLAFASLSNCQECDNAMESFHKCMENNHPKPPTGDDDHHKKVKECFEKNNCKAPEKPTGPPQIASLPSDGKNQQTNNNNNSNRDKFKQCGEQARSVMEQCLNQKGVKVPSNGPQQPQHGPPDGHDGPHPNFMANIQSCQQAASVMMCLQSVRPDRGQMENKFQEMCAAKTKCLSEISPSCQEMYNKTKKAMCDCANEKKSEISDKLSTCLGTTVQGGPDPDRIAAHHCQPDICDGGFQPFNGPFQGGPPQGGPFQGGRPEGGPAPFFSGNNGSPQGTDNVRGPDGGPPPIGPRGNGNN